MAHESLHPSMQARGALLTFALFGGAVAWTLQLLLCYAIAEFGCVAGWGSRTVLGLTPVAWLLLLVSIAMLAVACVATFVGWRMNAPAADGNGDASAWLARMGFIASGLFALVIAAQTLPILFYLSRC